MKDEILRFGIYDSDSVTDTKYPPTEKGKDEYIKQLEVENEKLKDLFGHIDRWCKAYPITIFPEPDFKKADKVLKENNISLSAISGSNMRHVVNGISELIQKVLEDKNE